MSIQTMPFWPVNLNRAVAPETLGADGARVMENMYEQFPGRLTRRKGVAPLDVAGRIYDIQSCAACQRHDGTWLLFLSDYAGNTSLVTDPAVQYTDLSEFGARGTDAFNEAFNEEGDA